MKEEKLFKEFLEEYLKNVKKELPSSYRAQQLEHGGIEAEMVYTFESRFLKIPFMKAIKKIKGDEKNE